LARKDTAEKPQLRPRAKSMSEIAILRQRLRTHTIAWMHVAELDGKPFTLWLTDTHDESVVFFGIARWDGSRLLLERQPKPSFEIRPEWYERIQPMNDEQSRKILLGANYFLRLYVGDLPEGTSVGEFEQTGLKWPK
jgi:hypothetical protein